MSAVDFPKVLVNFREFADKMGVKQIDTFEGSFLELDNIPKNTYDRVVIANYLRIEKYVQKLIIFLSPWIYSIS